MSCLRVGNKRALQAMNVCSGVGWMVVLVVLQIQNGPCFLKQVQQEGTASSVNIRSGVDRMVVSVVLQIDS